VAQTAARGFAARQKGVEMKKNEAEPKTLNDENERLENFHDRYFETGFFDHEERPKTVLAMEKLATIEELDDLDVIVLAPAAWKYGQVYPGLSVPKILVYLSPTLEEQPQAEVDFTVAQEFAHAYLRHDQYALNTLDRKIEDEADALVMKWGFTIPARRKMATA
jgi:hypothetical protein